MYDDIVIPDGLACAAGHLLTSWQTKSLDCELATYYVKEGTLFEPPTCSKSEARIDQDGSLRLITEMTGQPSTLTGDVEVHTFCNQCRPVLHAKPHWDRIEGREPWCQYVLTFVHGKMLGQPKSASLETRESIAREMRANGGTVIDDDSPEGVAHWALQKRRAAR